MKSVPAGQEALTLHNVLANIQAETEDAARIRESHTFDQLATPFSDRLVLFGAGLLGNITLAGLRRAEVEPVAFADNNRQLWGKRVNGLQVLSPEEAISRYASSACFVVTIYNGSAVRAQLAALGCTTVVPFTPLFWKYAKIFIPGNGVELPHTLRAGLADVRSCHSMLHDDTSRNELLGQLAWRYWLDYGALPCSLSPEHLYFPFDLLAPTKDEVFVDCGSFDGQTIRDFTDRWQSRFRHIFAFEPDSANRPALEATIKTMGLSKNFTVMPYAVCDRNGKTSFTSTGDVTSHIGGNSECVVDCKRLDDIDWSFPPTYLKMDIEGAEPAALNGARDLLRHYYPVLAICTYHRGPHLWELPNMIHAIAPEYRIFLRRYAEESWEGICYAIPPNRLTVA